jgi:hypothetical protein
MRGLGVGILVAALAVAGCGGGDESDTLPSTVKDVTTTTAPAGRALSDWQKASRSICSEYIPQLRAAIAAIESEATVEGVAAEFLKAQTLALEHVERLRSIPVPTERTREVEEVNDRLDRGRQGMESQRREITAGDYAGMNAYLGVLTNYADTDDLYLALDVPECAAPVE